MLIGPPAFTPVAKPVFGPIVATVALPLDQVTLSVSRISSRPVGLLALPPAATSKPSNGARAMLVRPADRGADRVVQGLPPPSCDGSYAYTVCCSLLLPSIPPTA